MREIDQLFADWADAGRRGDVGALLDLITDDAEFWTHGVPAMRGREAITAAFTQACSRYQLDQTWNELERFTGDDFVVSRGIEINRITPRAGGDVVEVTQRAWTLVKRCPDGRWRFARGITNRESAT